MLTSYPKLDANILSELFDLDSEPILFAVGKVDSHSQVAPWKGGKSYVSFCNLMQVFQ